jgi:Flp pilus assembly protein TadG
LEPIGEYRQFYYDAEIAILIEAKNYEINIGQERLGIHMKLEFGLFFSLSRLGKNKSRPGLLARFLRSEEGSTLLYMTLTVPLLIGIAGLGTEGGFWLYKHRVVQSAADNAAYSAASAYILDSTSDITAQARAITANDYNLVNGVNGVTVTVNRPPLGNCHKGTSNYTGANAIEVIVTQPETPLLSQIAKLSNNVNICGRAVAIIPNSGDCILALATTGVGITTVNNPNPPNNLAVTMASCSIFSNSTDPNSITMTGNNNTITADAIGTVGGIDVSGNAKSTIFNPTTGDPPVADPYATAAASWPTSQATAPAVTTTCAGCVAGTATPVACTNGNGAIKTIALSPGNWSSTALTNASLNKCTTVNLSSGTYVFAASPNVSGATLNIASGVKIIVTAGGLSTGTVNFGSGDYSIYIAAGGWTTSGTTTFGSGNYAIKMTGNWNLGAATTLGNGNYTFQIAGDLQTSANFTMGTGTYSGSMVNWTIQGTTTTIGAGIYYLSGDFNINGSGGQTVTANHVTLVLTGNTPNTAGVINFTSNNSSLTLTAPTAAGWNQGIAIWEPNSTGTNQFALGNSSIANIAGVIYAPHADVQYAGNTGSTPQCTQIVAKTVEFAGKSINLTGNCSGVPGVKVFGQIAALVE